MHDLAAGAGGALTRPGTRPGRGADRRPQATLSEIAHAYLQGGPADSAAIAREVLGLPKAPRAIAERLAAALLGADPRFVLDGEGRWRLVARPAPTALDLASAPLEGAGTGACPYGPAAAAPDLTSAPLEALPFAVVDVETTGLRARSGDRITEIAVVCLARPGSRAELALDSLVNPERPIPPWITALTGIDDRLVRDKPTFGRVGALVREALAGRVFVAHHARFDWAFVSAELERMGESVPDVPRLCTVRLARRLVPDLPRRNLDSLLFHFGIEKNRRHRAAGDALATAEVLRRLLLLATAVGMTTWGDLVAAGAGASP